MAQSQLKRCQYCKNSIYSGAKVCPICGKSQGMSTGKVVLGCLLGIVLIPVIGTAIKSTMEGYQEAKNKAENPSSSYTSHVASNSATSQQQVNNKPTTSQKSQEEIEKEYKMDCRPVTYERIMRETDMMAGQYVTITGKVSQVMPDGILRVDLTKDGYGLYSDSIVVHYSSSDTGFNVIEGDIITAWGISNGAERFASTVLGNEREIEVAAINARYIELEETNNENE